MSLYFRTLGKGEPILIMHGIFGSSDNWASIGKELSKNHKVFIVDLRNHGRSFHSNDFNYQLMAADVIALIKKESLTGNILLGHSMGGKVAMEIATSHPQIVNKLIVVDIAPKAYPVHHRTIIEALCGMDLTHLSSRVEADKELSKFIPEFGVRQFLLKNLERKVEGFNWKLNLNAIKNNIDQVGKPLATGRVFNGQTLFIRGGLSDYILDTDIGLIRSHFPNFTLKDVKNAGHWVHAEKPKELLNEIIQFLT